MGRLPGTQIRTHQAPQRPVETHRPIRQTVSTTANTESRSAERHRIELRHDRIFKQHNSHHCFPCSVLTSQNATATQRRSVRKT